MEHPVQEVIGQCSMVVSSESASTITTRRVLHHSLPYWFSTWLCYKILEWLYGYEVPLEFISTCTWDVDQPPFYLCGVRHYDGHVSGGTVAHVWTFCIIHHHTSMAPGVMV
ncbi:uncharacterized protein [Anabrus simplex]|uniref:uncharacterized protein n=1 Tax=Anabrus simplex TaxID=316456 RepID=UPI0035A3CB40